MAIERIKRKITAIFVNVQDKMLPDHLSHPKCWEMLRDVRLDDESIAKFKI